MKLGLGVFALVAALGGCEMPRDTETVKNTADAVSHSLQKCSVGSRAIRCDYNNDSSRKCGNSDRYLAATVIIYKEKNEDNHDIYVGEQAGKNCPPFVIPRYKDVYQTNLEENLLSSEIKEKIKNLRAEHFGEGKVNSMDVSIPRNNF